MMSQEMDRILNGIVDISDEEFNSIAGLVRSRFGINLTEKKKALVRGRLNKVLKQQGFSSFQRYYDTVMEDETGSGLLELVDKISTNHTFFFREKEHFNLLEKVILPEAVSRYGIRDHHDLKIWCAGCASGEEAYTLAMVVRRFFGDDVSWERPSILATDISCSSLEKAVEGTYVSERIKTSPEPYIKRYFHRVGTDHYQAKNSLKSMIAFRRLNFMEDSFPFKGKFHIIFCRNVMIYFDNDTKLDLIRKFHRYMHPEGYLFIGHSETLGRNTGIFDYIKPALYKKI